MIDCQSAFQRTSFARPVALAAILGRTALRRAMPTAAPLYLMVAVVSALLFGPSRLSAADACAAAIDSAGLRVGLWTGWGLLALPIVRSLLVVPESHWLRSLPVPAWWMWLVHGVLIAAAQLPWMLFWGGQGLATGLAHGLNAAAAQTLLLAPRLTPACVSLLVLTVTAPLALASTPVLLAMGPVALIVAIRHAWGRAPELGGRGGSVLDVFRGPRWAALSATYLIELWRGDPSRLARALLISCAGSGVIWLVIRNNQIEAPSRLLSAAMVILSPTLIMSLTGIAGRCLSAERECQWLLDVTSTGAIHRIVALCLTVAFLGLLCGVVVGSVLVLSIRPGLGLLLSARLLGASAAWGVTVGLLLSIGLRWVQLGGKAGGRELGAVLAVLAGTTAAAAAWREASIPLAFTAAALLVALSTRLRPRMSSAGET